MKLHQTGQTMTEYVVVVAALVGALLVTERAVECPGYDNCVAELLSKVHNRYKGFSNSISAVHKYESRVAEAYAEDWDTGIDETESSSGGGAAIPESIMQQQQAVTTGDGEVVGVIQGNQVVNTNGEVIGTYSGGIYTPTDGDPMPAGTTQVVTDEDGNIVEPGAMTDCNGNVDAFVYRSGVTGELHEPQNLNVVERDGRCGPYPSYQIILPDGTLDANGRIFEGHYYLLIQQPAQIVGDLLYVDTVDDDGNQIGPDCKVLGSTWDLDTSRTPLENYLDVVNNGNEIGTMPTSSCLSASPRDLDGNEI